MNIKNINELIPIATLYFTEYSKFLLFSYFIISIPSIKIVKTSYKNISTPNQKQNEKVINYKNLFLMNLSILTLEQRVIVVIQIKRQIINKIET